MEKLNNQGEPVTLPARREPVGVTSTGGYSLIQAKKDRGWNACLDEIAKLGPLYSRPAQGEPLAYMANVLKGSLAGQLMLVDGDAQLTPEMYEGPFAVYRNADPAEVERLRATSKRQQGVINTFECEVMDLRAQLAERDALLREADGLLRGGDIAARNDRVRVRVYELSGKIDATLSARAR